MFKKILVIYLLILITSLESANAYEFVDEKHSQDVYEMVTEIYDIKKQYEELAGEYEELEYSYSYNNLYWWPIGSHETEERNGFLFATGNPEITSISSEYGYRTLGGTTKLHGGIDIPSDGRGSGVINVIAVKSGEVINPVNESQTRFSDNGYLGNTDGGGYGNYVKIKHSDGTYSLYAHLAKDSITVMSGQTVEQGQVIAKMGHSGNSTGAHLHFEIRDASDVRVNPIDYVDPKNPRPISTNGNSNFSLTTTVLTREEFIKKMDDYCKRTQGKDFCNNFANNAGEIYDISIKYSMNPELVVVTAGTEQGFSNCGSTNNYWGIGIPNGASCSAGPHYSSILDGVAGYSKYLQKYQPGGSLSDDITNRYNERSKAGCDAGGHGLPGTLEGMQSIYSWIGNFRYNPGSSGSGGCYYLNIMGTVSQKYDKNYCDRVPTCSSKSATNNCPASSKTTICEQNDYTTYQLKGKTDLRNRIFGL